MLLTVTPRQKPDGTIDPARYTASIGDRVIVESARCPLFDAARALIEEGIAPDTDLEMQHAGSAIIVMRGKVGRLAEMTVDEGKAGARFGKFQPFRPDPHRIAA